MMSFCLKQLRFGIIVYYALFHIKKTITNIGSKLDLVSSSCVMKIRSFLQHTNDVIWSSTWFGMNAY